MRTTIDKKCETDFTTSLKSALQTIRRCRNNMSKYEFLSIVSEETNDANVAVPLMEAASVCSVDRLSHNATLKNTETQ